jgi:hypothetical protein
LNSSVPDGKEVRGEGLAELGLDLAGVLLDATRGEVDVLHLFHGRPHLLACSK